MAFVLPDLPYAYDALAPYISEDTMHVHHDKHHAGYTNNLNKTIAGYPQLEKVRAEELLRNLESVPEAIRTAVQNNGGGYYNHSFFWEIMGPRGALEPAGTLAAAIDSTFGSFKVFKETFSKAAATCFGSGWAWLVVDSFGKLRVYATPNQVSPLTSNHTPLLCLDVWEHAYYIDYQNRRGDYIAAWWNVVNWPAVAEKYAAAMG